MDNIQELAELPSVLKDILKRAEQEDEVLVRREDGRIFAIREVQTAKSPLDVPRVKSDITMDEINQWVREGRERLWDSELKRFVWPFEEEYAALAKEIDDYQQGIDSDENELDENDLDENNSGENDHNDA